MRHSCLEKDIIRGSLPGSKRRPKKAVKQLYRWCRNDCKNIENDGKQICVDKNDPWRGHPRIRSFHSIHNVVDRGVLQVMWKRTCRQSCTPRSTHYLLTTTFWKRSIEDDWRQAVTVRSWSEGCCSALKFRMSTPMCGSVAEWLGRWTCDQ